VLRASEARERQSPCWSRARDLRRVLAGVAKDDRRSSHLYIILTATANQVQTAGNGADHGDREHGGNHESEAEVVLSWMELCLFHDDPHWVDNTQTKSPEAFNAIRAFLPVRSS
jgi:hypothetical protein